MALGQESWEEFDHNATRQIGGKTWCRGAHDGTWITVTANGAVKGMLSTVCERPEALACGPLTDGSSGQNHQLSGSPQEPEHCLRGLWQALGGVQAARITGRARLVELVDRLGGDDLSR
jgi:hypothetical protein